MIIPCLGHPDLLQACLGGLAAQRTGRRFEVIVVDSGGDDAVAGVARDGGARLVRSKGGRLLPADARNLGAAHADGPIFAFLDADAVPAPGWVEAAYQGLAPGVHLAGGAVSDLWPWHPIARIDNLLQFNDLQEGRSEGPAHAFAGCNLAMRREDFVRTGGFAQTGPEPAGEDVSFCLRVDELWPGSLYFVPEMLVRHAGRRRLADFLRHHHSFGRVRGAARLLVRPAHVRLGRHALLIPLVVARRLIYILVRVMRWRPATLPAMLLLLPLMLAGLTAWAVGFRAGLLRSYTPSHRATEARELAGTVER